MNKPIWYRIIDWATAPGYDENGDPLPGPGGVEVSLCKWWEIKRTSKGVWLSSSSYCEVDRRWINTGAHRRFACPTITEALESFCKRKDKQRRIYLARADSAERAKKLALQRFGEERNNPDAYPGESLLG